MAILQGCPGVKVTIVSNGQALEEYPDDDGGFNNKDFSAPPGDHQALHYVECTSEAEFGIKLELSQEYDSYRYGEHTHFAFWAFVDGQGIGGVINNVGTWRKDMFHAAGRISATEQFRRKLKFSSITKVDDTDSARVKTDAKLAAGLGEIIVYVHRCNMRTLHSPHIHATTFAAAPAEISEKALKGQAISHGVSFGEEVRVRVPEKTTEPVYPDDYHNPLGVFRFRYRSREALKQELIIPRSPSPGFVMGPLNPRNQSTANAAISKEQRLARLKREIEEIKSEEDDGNPRDRKRCRDSSEVQSSGRAYRTSRHSNGSVVVDLTDD
ncbi:hypothetical protein N431DRAFT_415093 [Stipitochalara longipes BDJ]|nr:hypothetical protein N431DRAFT_415093 [Stipitochalara longipes BDJ]